MKSFDYLWQLLAPASVYENKKNMCKELWYSFPLTQQRTIYAIIQKKKNGGGHLHPNPYFVIEDHANAQPDFLSGVDVEACWADGIQVVQVYYNKRYKLCTLAEAKIFDLQITKEFNPNEDF